MSTNDIKVICPRCDFENPFNITFCGSCSYNLKKSDQGSLETVNIDQANAPLTAWYYLLSIFPPFAWIFMSAYKEDPDKAKTMFFISLFLPVIYSLVMIGDRAFYPVLFMNLGFISISFYLRQIWIKQP